MSPGHNLPNFAPGQLFIDARGKPRILTVTTRMPQFANAVFVVAGCDPSLAVTKETEGAQGGL